MAQVIVGHPDATFSGYLRVAGRGLLFMQGFTEPISLSPAQQAELMDSGFTVDGQPPTPVPDPFPQYLTVPRARQLVTTDEEVLASQRAASELL
ncbi:hypothetical protein, partial [Blastococcus sp. CCUG 61487]|uniref:hypothetical protein n=1 Tax=Blastococcus sp. CCUG 61487 TaxID=1840703 RepID=UPI0010BF84BF